jgi:hypothetical protein
VRIPRDLHLASPLWGDDAARHTETASGVTLIDGRFRVRGDKIDTSGKLTLRHDSRLHVPRRPFHARTAPWFRAGRHLPAYVVELLDSFLRHHLDQFLRRVRPDSPTHSRVPVATHRGRAVVERSGRADRTVSGVALDHETY